MALFGCIFLSYEKGGTQSGISRNLYCNILILLVISYLEIIKETKLFERFL